MITHCVPLEQRAARLAEDGLDVKSLRNLCLVHHGGNTSVRRKLEQLPVETFNSCMIFADQLFEADTMHADSHSLATLLLIRDIQQMRMEEKENTESQGSMEKFHCPVICEVLDPR